MMETFADGEDSAADGDEKETATPAADTPDLITYIAVGKMTEHDRSALVPALEDMRTRGVGPRELLADTHYGSADNMVKAQRRGTALVAPAMTAKGKKQGHRTLEDFTLDKEGRIEGSISRYKYQMNMGILRVRGKPSVGYVARLRALGLNIFRVAAWRRSSSGKEPAVA